MRFSVTLCLISSIGLLGLACQGDPKSAPSPDPETCTAHSQPCEGRCVDVSTDPAHCGACGQPCSDEASCVQGVCTPEGEAPCTEGRSRCGGACVLTESDPAHCGACDQACGDHQGCVDGACADLPCEPGHERCDASCVDTQADDTHCGGCGQPCAAGERCQAGRCVETEEEPCTGEAILCDGKCTDVQSDPLRCGSCDRSCESYQDCVVGACADLPCEGDHERCDGVCVDTDESDTHCGGCGIACPSTSFCIEGSCTCTGGLELCAEVCTDTMVNDEHCGTCDNACPAPDARIAGASCGWGGCLLTCRDDYGNCDGDPGTGCEVDLLTTTAHCGECGSNCLGLAHVDTGTHCDGGTCILTCQADYEDCDESPENGCESDLRSETSCGACDNDCTQLPHVQSASCDEDTCKIEACAAGYVDEDEDPSNGCEAVLPSPSCDGGGDGRDDCGPDGDESCCLSLPVSGGTFDRKNNTAAPATVSAYRLDKYQVTVGRYRQFVAEALDKGWTPAPGAGKHLHVHNGQGLLTNAAPNPPTHEGGWDSNWNTHVKEAPCAGTWDDGGDENRPIGCINWYEAQAFCIWDGGFLATEAEWSFAATCGSEQRKYPWGSDTPTSNLAVYSGSGAVQPVGSKPLGAGCFGHLDLAGNAAEWIADGSSTHLVPCTDCTGSLLYTTKTPKGGTHQGVVSALENTASGTNTNPINRAKTYAIRCARAP